MRKTNFDWDDTKEAENIAKHGMSFALAQYAFLDPKRVITEDLAHSEKNHATFVSE